MNLIEGAAYIGSAALLYHGMKKENVLTDEKLKYGAAGALVGLYLGPKLEEKFRNDNTLSPEEKQLFYKVIGGAAAGGGLVYLLSQSAGSVVKQQLDGLFRAKESEKQG